MHFSLLVYVVPVSVSHCHTENFMNVIWNTDSELRKCYLLCFSRSRIHSLKQKNAFKLIISLNTTILIVSSGIDSVLLDWIFKNYLGVIL